MPDKAVTFFDDVLRKTHIPVIAVYNSPTDYPGRYVARVWRILPSGPELTPIIITAETLHDIRAKKPAHMLIFDRHDDDDPALVECWM